MSAHPPERKRFAEPVVVAVAAIAMLIFLVIRISERVSRQQSEWEDSRSEISQALDKPPAVSKD